MGAKQYVPNDVSRVRKEANSTAHQQYNTRRIFRQALMNHTRRIDFALVDGRPNRTFVVLPFTCWCSTARLLETELWHQPHLWTSSITCSHLSLCCMHVRLVSTVCAWVLGGFVKAQSQLTVPWYISTTDIHVPLRMSFQPTSIPF